LAILLIVGKKKIRGTSLELFETLGWGQIKIRYLIYYYKKRIAVFPAPAWMSLTILSLAGNNLIIAGQGEFGK
jgi:hypothetical protein